MSATAANKLDVYFDYGFCDECKQPRVRFNACDDDWVCSDCVPNYFSRMGTSVRCSFCDKRAPGFSVASDGITTIICDECLASPANAFVAIQERLSK